MQVGCPIVPRFYFDLLDGEQVLEDPHGIEFADLKAALAEAAQGARGLVAHAILENEDVSEQSFLIRGEGGEGVATMPFRSTLPGRLKEEASPGLVYGAS